MVLFPRIVRLLKEKGGENVLVIGGGIIPKKDIPALKKAGITQVFGPGTTIDEIADYINKSLQGKNTNDQ